MNTTIQKTNPQTLMNRITEEAVILLALGGDTAIPETEPHMQCVSLIGKAWKLSGENTAASLKRIVEARTGTTTDNDSGKLNPKLSDGPALDTPDGVGIALFLRGLFETAVQLDDRDDRAAILRMATSWPIAST